MNKPSAVETDVLQTIEMSLDVLQSVKQMREQRMLMVQTLEQYQFIYWALEYSLTAMDDAKSSNLQVALVLRDTAA